MEITTPPHIGPDADPALLADKPMTWPPTGNPRVFGPGRSRPADRVLIWLGGAALAAVVAGFTLFEGGRIGWSGLVTVTGRDVALYLLAAVILGGAWQLAASHPRQMIILRVDDHGLMLRGLRPYVRARSFAPFALLDTVRLSAPHRSGDLLLQIELRRGARWRSWAFDARLATGADGLVIAEEIAARAAAAGITVTPEKGTGWHLGTRLWRFEPPTDTQERGA